MTESPVHLTLAGRLAYEDDITVGEATQIIAFIDAARTGHPQPRLTPDGSPPLDPPKPEDQGHRMRTIANPRDALDLTGAKNNAEKIVALAAYVLQDGELDTFTLDTVRPLFRRARESTPANIHRDLDKAIAAGWIADSETKGEFYLTARAEDVLDVTFAEVRKRGGTTTKARGGVSKKSRTIKVPEAFEGIDVVATPMPDAPTYGSVKLKRDKVLWAVKLAKQLGMSGLNNKQIVWLTDKLGDGIQSNDINAHFRGLQRPGYANRSTIDNVIRITPSGEAYLKSLAANGA